MDLTNFFSDNSIIFNCKSQSKKNVLEIISKIMSEVTSTKEDIIFEVRNLSKIFKSVDMYGNTEMIKALDNISFSVRLGHTMGIVGESGSGKSTIGRCVLG